MKEIFSHKIKQAIIRSVVFTNDERFLLYAYQTQKIGTIHTTKFTVSQLTTVHTSAVYALAISSSNLMASAGYDRYIYLWEYLQHSQYRSCGKIPVPKQPILHLAFSPDSKILVSGGMDNKIRLWLLENSRPVTTVRADNKLLLAMDFSPTENVIMGGGLSAQINIWRVDGTHILSKKMSDGITSAIFTEDTKIAVGLRNGIVEIWDARNWQKSDSYSHHKGYVRCLGVSKDGRFLASGGNDAKIVIYDLVRKATKFHLKEKSPVCCIAFSNKSGLLAAGLHNGMVKLYGD
jgi:WD40 repeat protein